MADARSQRVPGLDKFGMTGHKIGEIAVSVRLTRCLDKLGMTGDWAGKIKSRAGQSTSG